jgi:methylmalonyl-CoA mutase C-terminal domain/subunit
MNKNGRKIRVLLGKPGLCGHDRGVLVLAMALSEAGMEVIYSGTISEQLVEAASRMDILSQYSFSAHLSYVRIVSLLRSKRPEDICLLRRFIPDEDVGN